MAWRSEQISSSGFRTIRSTPAGKCPVCGEPGSNCSSGKENSPKILLTEEAPPEKQMIRVLEDIVEERQVGQQTITTIKASAGDYLTKPEAEELGLI